MGSVDDWGAYYQAVAGKPPRETLVLAVDAFDRDRRGDPPAAAGSPRPRAADLGCGEGRDTVELLRRGWEVVAVDSSAEALSRLEARVPVEARERLTLVHGGYEDAAWGAVDLVNASYSIPHCREGAFAGLWEKIAGSIREGGRFAGQLFGVRDGWMNGDGAETAGPPRGDPGAAWRDGRQFLARVDVERMLREGRLEAETFREEEGPGKTALGDVKYWHVFHVVARRAAR